MNRLRCRLSTLPRSSASLLGEPSDVPYAVLHARTPGPGRRDRSKLPIAHIVALSGTAGNWGPSSLNSAVLPATAINTRGVILGPEVEFCVHDSGAPLADLRHEARDLVEFGDTDGAMVARARVGT